MNDPGFDDFAQRVNDQFIVQMPDGRPVALQLAEVRRLPPVPHAPRPEPFALLFAGPSQPMLDQATHRLAHDGLGELDIFLVPVGPAPAGGLLYEAIFN